AALMVSPPTIKCRIGMRLASSATDRKSTRLNSSHLVISYAVFCLKKKIRRPCERRPVRFATRRRSRTGTGLGSRRHRRDRGRCPGRHFFFKDRAPPEIYTLSLPDALPI